MSGNREEKADILQIRGRENGQNELDNLDILRGAKVLNIQGITVREIFRALGISVLINYRWRKEYGGMGPE